MSPKFDTVKKYFDLKVWSIAKVKNAVAKNWITPDEFLLITGQDYTE